MTDGSPPEPLPGDDRGATDRIAGTRFGPVRWFGHLDSTNRYAHDEVVANGRAAAGLVVVADRQTAGRGRLGRSWEAPAGASLLVSAVVTEPSVRDDGGGAAREGPERPRRRSHQGAEEWLPLVTPAAGLAAADALRSLAGIDARLKWPNDLVVDDRKLAGLLAEAVGTTATVVVGMGVNVRWVEFPPDLAGIATSCNFLSDRPVDRADLLVEWLRRYDALLTRITTPEGRARTRDEYAARSATLGRRVRIELPNRTFEGLATGVAPSGALEVKRDDGALEAVAAGDVVHLRPA